MGDSFDTVPLSEIVDPDRGISYGIVQPGQHLPDGVPIIRVTDIRNGRVDPGDPLRVAPDIAAKYRRTHLRGGELLLTVVGTVGETAVVPPELAGWNTARAVAVVPVLPDPGPRWVQYALATGPAREYIDTRLNTTVQATLNLRDVSAFPVPMPPRPVRDAVLGILGTLDDKIELNRRMNETLEAIARALFKSWFVDFDAVRAKAQSQTPPGMDPATAALFPSEFEDSELGEIPKGWRVEPLKGWVDALSGGTPSKKNVAYWGGDIPWISPKVMTTIHADRAEHYVTEAAIGNGTRLAPAGATLVMVRGMGLHQEVRVSQALRDVTFNQDVKALVGTGIEPTLLLFALLDAQQVLLGRVESSGHGTGRLPRDVMLSYPLVMPEVSTQETLARRFGDINRRIALLRAESQTLARARDALLPRLLSGELSVAQAEQAVEATA